MKYKHSQGFGSLSPLKYNVSVAFYKVNLDRCYENYYYTGHHVHDIFVIMSIMDVEHCLASPITYYPSTDFLHPYLFPFLLDMCQDTINSLYVVCFNTERAAR